MISDALQWAQRGVGPTVYALWLYAAIILGLGIEAIVCRLTHRLRPERVQAMRDSLRHAADQSTLLGLLGTFVGLAFGMPKLKDSTQFGIFMGTAILSTVWGVIQAFLATEIARHALPDPRQQLVEPTGESVPAHATVEEATR